MKYYPAETQVTPLTNVRRERVLPLPGEILVEEGDQVEPMQVVARTEVPGDSHILPIARLLGLPTAKVDRCLRVKSGEAVEKGQIVARRGRWFGPAVRSPIDGWVVFSGGGRLLIEAEPTLFELKAYIPGTVTNVVEPHGLVIETTGAVAQGVWGSGGEGLGVLKRMAEQPDDVLRGEQIDPACHGMILIAGAGLDEHVIKQAEMFQVRGIVVGGLSPRLVERFERSPFPIVVTEGIGEVPMSLPIFQLLTTNDGREAVISGNVQYRWPLIRPEVVIPLPAAALSESPFSSDSLGQPGSPLTVGMPVRVLRAPYMGMAGEVVGLPSEPRYIETGARVHGAEVDFGGDEIAFVPLLNIEVLR